MQKVFISYSWKDEAVALRLYRELRRQNISIWLDRIDGEPTGDFKQEFMRLIGACDYFVVIDSENYRHKSHWCETELQACFSRIDDGQKVSMIVCLADEDEEWRNPDAITDSNKRALFERLNKQKYLKLSHSGTYDNDRTFAATVESICRILGKDSFSWNTFPEEEDLIDELDIALKGKTGIGDDEHESLICLMKAILLRRRKLLDVKPHFQLLISDCEKLGLNIFVPRWAYGIWLADSNHAGRFDKECLDCMNALAKDFPDEPRAFRGLGGIAARLNQLKLAADSFCNALDLTRKESGIIRYEILCNLGQVYMNMEHYHEAKDAMSLALDMIDNDDLNESLFVNFFECLMQLNMKSEAGTFIKTAAQEHKTAPCILRSCGYYFLDCDQPSTAISYLKKSYALNPSIENAYGYLCGLIRCGNIQEYHRILSSVIKKPESSEDDAFWKKEILDLNNRVTSIN